MPPRFLRQPAPGRTRSARKASPQPGRQVPLYGSSAQDSFAWHIAHYLAERARVTRRAEIAAPAWPGRPVFIVDFLIEIGGRRIAVECAGSRRLKGYLRERERDARLVASGAVDVVYRMTGSDALDRIQDVLFLMAHWEQQAGAGRYLPDPFSGRGRTHLRRLASPEARGAELRSAQAAVLVRYLRSTGPCRRARRNRHSRPHLLLRRFDRRFASPWADIAAPAPKSLSAFPYTQAA